MIEGNPNGNGTINVTAGTNGATTPPAQTATTPATGDWTTGLNDELKGYAQLKGFKDPSMLMEAYRGLEKTIGVPKERIVKLPEGPDAPEWGEVYGKLGRPEKPEDYKIAMPKEGGSEEFASWAKNTFHKLGLSGTQAEKLSSQWNEFVQASTAKAQEAENAKNIQEEQKLRTEWGQNFDREIEKAKRAAAGLGIKGDTFDAFDKILGPIGTLRFFQTIGSKLGEDAFVSSASSPGFSGMGAGAAKAKIEALKRDKEWTKKFTSGDVAAKEEWNRLNQIAFS